MRTWTLAFVLTLLAAGGAADEVRLTNGRTLEGKATVLADGRVEIEASFGTLVLAAGQVLAIRPSTPLAEEVAALQARLDPGDAEGLYRLALWAREKGAATLARALLEQVLALDPDHEGARRALGYRRYQERWVTAAEHRALRGEVRFRGGWVPAAERDRVLAWETAAHLAEAERRRQAAFSAELESRRLAWLAARELSHQPPPVYLYGAPVFFPGAFPQGAPAPPPLHRPGVDAPPGAGGQAPPLRPLAGPRQNRGSRSRAGAPAAPAPRLRSGRPSRR